MSRIRNQRDCAHQWAHQTRENGRAGSLYFRGDTIYSYGNHFPIARHFKGCVLMTIRTYSVSTSRHVRYTRQACSHLTTFHVARPTDEPKEILKDYADRIQQSVLEMEGKNRSLAQRMEQLESLVSEANEFCRLMNYKKRFNMPDLDGVREYISKHHKAEARRAAKRERDAKKKAAALRAEALESMPKWMAGEIDYMSGFGFLPADYMRVSGSEIETTRGAYVPVEHVRKALPLVLGLIRNGKTYMYNGHSIHVGHYTLNSIDEQGTVRVGCHTFERAEVERIANILGVSQ